MDDLSVVPARCQLNQPLTRVNKNVISLQSTKIIAKASLGWETKFPRGWFNRPLDAGLTDSRSSSTVGVVTCYSTKGWFAVGGEWGSPKGTIRSNQLQRLLKRKRSNRGHLSLSHHRHRLYQRRRWPRRHRHPCLLHLCCRTIVHNIAYARLSLVPFSPFLSFSFVLFLTRYR